MSSEHVKVLQRMANESWRGSPEHAALTAAIAALSAPQPPAEAHCATCACAPGMTPAIRFDATAAEKEGAVREQLIRMGWSPPAEAQPDWEAAPPGATHYQPHQDAYYKRVSASEWYVWSRVEDRELLRWLPSPGTSDSAEWVVRPTDAHPPPSSSVGVRYDAGLLSDYGGGNVGWWHDYIRSELDRAHDFYTEALAQQPAAAGEEIMVNAAHDVYTLPLQPSGLSSGPRFVVHVPAPEQQPAAPVLAKHQPCGCVICTCEDEQQCQGCGAKHCGNRADHPPYAVQQPAAVDDLMNAWREAFIAERATRYREGGMKIEQARIHAETDAARIYALAAAAKGVGND